MSLYPTADFRPEKPRLDSLRQKPKGRVRLDGVLLGPDGRALISPPTIELNELFDQPSPPTKEIEVPTAMPTVLKESAVRSGSSTGKPFRLPFMYDNIPTVDLPKKTFEKKSFLDDPLDRFRSMVDGHDELRRSINIPEINMPEIPPLPNWERNFDPPHIREKSQPIAVCESEEIPIPERFDDVDVFLARKKGMELPKTESVADSVTESVTEPIIVPKRIIVPTVRGTREAVFRRKRPHIVHKSGVAPEKRTPFESSADELLRTENLTKSYYKKRLKIPVLKGVNLSILTGEFVSIIGQSGSGKSTLLHLLGTLDVPEGGEIYFENRRIDNLSNSRRDLLRNKSIGFIFQFYHLLPELTTLENVLSPLMIQNGVLSYFFRRRQYIEKAKELLDKVGLSHRLKHKPCELSGGEMQRAAIARALIAEPKILLADEPTGNLDAASAAEIIELLQGLKADRKLTILMVTHDNQIAAAADRIVRMVDGVIDN